jgi:hypothetical protein
VGAGEDQRAEGGRRRSNREITQGLLEADLAIMSQQCYLSAGTRLQKVGEEADGWRRTGDGLGILGRLGGVDDLNMHEATDGVTPRVAGCSGIWLRAGEMGRIVSYVIFVCVAAPTTAAAQEKTSQFQRAKIGLAQGSRQSSSSQCSLEMLRSSAQLRGLHWSDCWQTGGPRAAVWCDLCFSFIFGRPADHLTQPEGMEALHRNRRPSLHVILSEASGHRSVA